MRGGALEGLYSLFFILAVVGCLVLGGYLALKYVKPVPETVKPPSQPTPAVPEPIPHGWGPGPWGPDPWVPSYNPDVPSVEPEPAHKPAPADNFKPVLTLMEAKYNPVGREIQVKCKILPSGSVPPSKSYSIAFNVMEDGKNTVDIPEDEPLSASEMSGFEQVFLVPVTGASKDVTADKLTLSGQIKFRENGTVNSGVVGVPTTINVS